MDFLETADQVELASLARWILLDADPSEPRVLLEELGRADLLGLSVTENLGGTGTGLVEACLVLRELGRTLKPVPLLENLLLSAAPLAEFGSAKQIDRWLPGLLAGSTIGTAALNAATSAQGSVGSLTAQPEGSGWRLHGTAGLVPWAVEADVVLVQALTTDGRRSVVLVVGAQSIGFTAVAQETLGRSRHGALVFDDVAVDADWVLADPEHGDAVSTWISDRLAVGRCAFQLGICEEALRLTADYVQQRKQFGKPIGDFQAVRQRLADSYIDTEAIRLTMLQAAWLLSVDLPAQSAISTAKFWASDAGHRAVHSAVHLHGGVGIDENYPLHRFFLAGMEVRSLLGSRSETALEVMTGADEQGSAG